MHFLLRNAWLTVALLHSWCGSLAGREVQSHGLWWERWLCDTFFDGYRPPARGYTQKWDIPASANARHGGLPVNPKAVKFGSPIGLGDALRQFDVGHETSATPFLLIVGFWDQITPETKRMVQAEAIRVTPEIWRQLWHPITRADLEKLNQVIRDPSLSLEEARTQAQALKSKPPFTEAVMQVNPKIDRSQRRLQCSLSFQDFFAQIAVSASPRRSSECKLWGVPIPPLTDSPARTLSPGAKATGTGPP